MSRRPAVTAAISLGLVALIPATTGAASASALAPTSAFTACGDYDGISALGSPLEKVNGISKQGTLRVRHVTGGVPAQTVTATSVGLPNSGVQFGYGTSTARINSTDTCTDVVVGAPATASSAGRVVLIPGSGDGLNLERAIVLDGSAVGITNGDQLGAAVTTLKVEGGVVVVAGAPGHDFSGAKDAGAVVAWFVPEGGEAGTIPTPSAPVMLRQGAGGIQGTADSGDHFGKVLAQPSQAGTAVLTIGIPDEDISSYSDTGAVAQITFSGFAVASNTLVWEGSGMPSSKKSGDRFGYSVVAPRGVIQAIGIPGKNADGDTDSGAIVVRTPAGAYQYVSQDTKGVPGSSEKGDAFGTALGYAYGYHGPETATVVVGAAGENIGSNTDQGSVTLIDNGSESSALTYASQATSGLKGKVRFGQTIAVVSGDPAYDEDTHDTVLVGAPGSSSTGSGKYYRAVASGISSWESGMYFATQAS